MSFLTRFSLKNKAAILIIAVLFILGGIYSFSNLKVELMPDIEFPSMSVEVIYPGASPETINESVTSQLEEKLKGVDGVKKIQSSTYDSIALITLEFPFKTDLDKTEQLVNSAIKDTKLPSDVQTKVNRYSTTSEPIYNISLFAKGNKSIDKLINEDLIPELTKIQGVNQVSVGGLEEHLLQITVDKEKAEENGITLNQIKEILSQKNLSLPAGNVNDDSLQIPIRVQENVNSIEKIKKIKITPQFLPNVKPIELGSIAEISKVDEKSEITRYNLKDSYSMAITKKQDANTVEIADKVLDVLKKYDHQFDYAIGFDQAEAIKGSVGTLIREGLLGALFASLAVLLFLRNIRATFIAIISIPMSLLIASIVMSKLNISLNIMTLGGMAVAVGRVVDDSIVVIENIFRRTRRADHAINSELVQKSTKEIVKAITSSTITTIVVFLPIGLVGGISGEFFMPFAITVVISLIASLLVAITIVPVLAQMSFKRVPKDVRDGFLQRIYGKTISWSLQHKALVLIVSVMILLSSVFMVSKLGFVFIPNEQQKTLIASVQLPASTSLERTNEIALDVEKMFAKNKKIKDVTAGIGSRDFTTGLKRTNQANYFITIGEGIDSATFISKLEHDMEKIVLPKEPKAKVGAQEMVTGPPANNKVNIDLYSNDLNALQQASKRVEAYMGKQKDLKYVTNNFSEKQKQVDIDINPEKADEYGISNYQILGAVSELSSSIDVGVLKINDTDRNVQLIYNKDLQSVDNLKKMKLQTSHGPVLLSEVANVKLVDTFSSIQKLDGKVFAEVSAQVASDNISQVTTATIDGVKKEVKLPKGVSFEGGGGSDETTKTFTDMGLAMLIAIGLVYITMLITFGKARIPFIILTSLIFVPIGSFFGLFITGEPLSVSVMIGLLMLIGIVATNAIVLVDRVGQNRDEKAMTIHDALLEAGKTRLRPILMTAFATITALIPLALTTSSGTFISKGLAITVIGGLTSSTILTLIIIPVIYELFFFKKVKHEKKAKIKLEA